MDSIDKLLEYTISVIEDLEQTNIDQISNILDMRDDMLKVLEKTTELNLAEKKQLQILADFDHVLVEKMEQLKQEAANQLIKISNSRRQQDGYLAQNDAGSFFIDNRK